jgi:transposase
MKRKAFTVDFKAKVAIEAIKGHKTTNELASEFAVHATQINAWKKQLVDGSRDVFSQGKQKQAADFEQEKERLYSQIGRLKVEADWIKKKTGHLI